MTGEAAARLEDADRAMFIEHDIAEGEKRTYEDLDWYLNYKKRTVFGVESNMLERTKLFWRHKESQTVYVFHGLGLAATGQGKLVLMVHYVPESHTHGPIFERQYALFMERFEHVTPERVWKAV